MLLAVSSQGKKIYFFFPLYLAERNSLKKKKNGNRLVIMYILKCTQSFIAHNVFQKTER